MLLLRHLAAVAAAKPRSSSSRSFGREKGLAEEHHSRLQRRRVLTCRLRMSLSGCRWSVGGPQGCRRKGPGGLRQQRSRGVASGRPPLRRAFGHTGGHN